MVNYISIKFKLIVGIVVLNALIFSAVLFSVVLINISSIEKNIAKSETTIRNSIIARGKTLSENNSIALKGLVEDNAFSDIRNLVSATVAADTDIVYGIFMDDNKIPWVNADADNPSGMVRKRKRLEDEASNWASQLSKTSHSEFEYKYEEVIEFSAPVKIEDETAGFIRYGISTMSMKSALKETYDDNIVTRNNTIKMLAVIGLFSFIITFLLVWVIVQVLVSTPIQDTITKIIEISKGNLSVTFNTGKNDEIGVLGNALNNLVSWLNKRSAVATSIANGDLRQEIQLVSEDDSLGIALKEMISGLNDMIGILNKTGTSLATEARQFSELSKAQLGGAINQIESLTEIAASMTNISNRTNTNAANAKQANKIFSDTSEKCSNGVANMDEMVRAMDTINISSNEIGKIIKTIDGIAFQTNLLAINASIEAARAGKNGKGFAVVANEVRRLSASCTSSAQETTELIEEALKNIHSGNSIAQLTSKSLEEINLSVSTVAGLMSEISDASQEQVDAITSVDESISRIDAVTRKNKTGANKTSNAADTLSRQAEKVNNLLKQFKLKN